jgi:hypothetical protein
VTESSVTTSPAVCYTVRNGWAWANLYVRHGSAKVGDQPRYWVELSINSDYGSFGFYWSHIGGDWRKFLAGIDMHYAMNKMMGSRFMVPLTGYEAAAEARKIVLDGRRHREFDKREASVLWEAIDLADKDADATVFLRSWDDGSEGLFYGHELYSGGWNKVNPQAEGFWQEVWPHFVLTLRAEVESQCPVSVEDGF